MCVECESLWEGVVTCELVKGSKYGIISVLHVTIRFEQCAYDYTTLHLVYFPAMSLYCDMHNGMECGEYKTQDILCVKIFCVFCVYSLSS